MKKQKLKTMKAAGQAVVAVERMRNDSEQNADKPAQ